MISHYPDYIVVFPAYAGVIPVAHKRDHPADSVPRVCGGDPTFQN